MRNDLNIGATTRNFIRMAGGWAQWVVLTTTIAVLTVPVPSAVAAAPEVTVYKGMCDASAAVALDARHFVVADDELNWLPIYRRGMPSPIGGLGAKELSKFLDTKINKESDLEGAVKIGDRIYWISSHGRNKKGKRQKRRLRLFATDIVRNGIVPTLKLVGKPYTKLLDDLITDNGLKEFGFKQASERAPEAPGGLNIEGFAVTSDGDLLIGFRNPIPGGKALVVVLKNPNAIVEGRKDAKLGKGFGLKLGGRGVRSLERVGDGYLIVAGPPADEGSFEIRSWSGRDGDEETTPIAVELGTLRPEALFVVPGTDMVQVLSDDGGVMVDGKECKKLDKSVQSFRSVIFKP